MCCPFARDVRVNSGQYLRNSHGRGLLTGQIQPSCYFVGTVVIFFCGKADPIRMTVKVLHGMQGNAKKRKNVQHIGLFDIEPSEDDSLSRVGERSPIVPCSEDSRDL